MDVVSLSTLPAAAFVWQPAPDRWAITVVCKATFTLEPGSAALAADQEPIRDKETHWDDDPKKSLFSPCDLVPFKRRADVVLVGSAYARNDVPVRSAVARIVVGDVDKSIEVFGPRVRTRDGELREGKRWTKMPLLYERAAGGPGTPNPVGIRPDGPRDLYGQVQLPNLQPPGLEIGDATIPTVGFGPIAAGWIDRRSKAPKADHDPARAPFGEGFDPAFFQVAPRDQQADEIRPGERIVLESLHPKHGRLVTNLPDLRPCALVERDGIPAQEVALAADTLWIDTHRAICTVTWRGRADVDGPDPQGRVLVATVKGDQKPSWPALAPPRPAPRVEPPAQAAPAAAAVDAPPPREMTVSDLDAWDITQTEAPRGEGADASQLRSTAQALPALLHEPDRPALPFQPPPPGWQSPAAISFGPAPVPGYDPRLTRVSTQKLDMTGFRAGLPAWLEAKPPPPAPPAPPAPPPPDDLAAPFPAPMVPVPVAPAPMVPVPVVPVPVVPAVVSFGPPPPPPPSQPAMPIPVPSQPASLLEASNAAAAATERPATTPSEPAPPPRADVVELLWYDPALPARLRKHPALAPLLRPDPAKPPEPAPAAPATTATKAPAPDPAAVEELARVHVHDALTRAAPLIGVELEEALDAAEDESPPATPLVVVSGDLELCFDEAAQLKAIVSAASPLAAGDKKLKDAVDLAASMLDAPLQGAPEVADALGARIREAWGKANRIFPQGYLAAATERLLLDQRKYQIRELLDDTWIRALLAGPKQKTAIPTYLPAKIAKRLPLFKRFPARLAVEVLPQQDQAEAHPLALRALAIGRVRARRW